MAKEKLTAIEKFGWGVVGFLVLLVLGGVGLFGWAFIELIQWITSK